MNESVYETQEGAVTSGNISEAEPGTHWHDAMMIDMQQGDLAELLTSDEAELKWSKVKCHNCAWYVDTIHIFAHNIAIKR